MKKKISREKVKDLVMQDLTDKQIASKLNCHYSTIFGIRKELGLMKGKKKAIVGEKIVKLFESGIKDVKEIADTLMCTPSYARSVLIKRGLIAPKKRNNASEKFVQLIMEKPMFTFELKRHDIKGVSTIYKFLRLTGFPIKRFVVSRNMVIYYFDGDEGKALSRISELKLRNLGSIARTLGLRR